MKQGDDSAASGQRLFVGMRLPEDARHHLAEYAEELHRDVGDGLRLISPDNYHITLYFIGDPRPLTAGVVQTALEEKVPAVVDGVLPLDTTIDRWGAFPSWKRPRVVWAGVQDPGAIAQIAEQVTQAMISLGLEPPRRRFTPHITVGYIRRGYSAANRRREYLAAERRGAVTDTSFGAPVAVGLNSVSLINSTPGPDGSTYEDLKMWSAQS
jgi:2'-5' RNA ligase